MYIAAMYWAMMTVTTIGYGEFSIVTLEGRIIGTISVLFGIILSQYIVV